MNELSSWNAGPAREAIEDFVRRTTGGNGTEPVPTEHRVAVFDNDGTLWCEKPMPIQADFIVRRLAEMADEDPRLRERQPWKAAHARDLGWFARVVAAHYAGDDSELPTLLAGILEAFAGISVEAFMARSGSFLSHARHPTLNRRYLECGYAPMIELLHYLTDHGFSTYIASGGGRDFMRPITEKLYGVPAERVIGSSAALTYVPDEHGGTIRRTAAADFLDDGPEKPVRIWSRTGRRPMLAAGNADGDIPMLEYTRHDDRPFLRLLVRHDDPEREFGYVSGAERALERAESSGWTVVSMKRDWLSVFDAHGSEERRGEG
ncbi:haloacid dehalogenase-like hydrolase [Georgenia yuyongxinii]|uniref:Haloacid dehalogenase-like hydrolase n=1 Tax=Georgenia yuyongxinii TaxID=2589797 RepID=A0A5B8C419_9MICO|nr:HAD family hydrolase [Georgenia yuyongxinii]QDC25314.1 haloacid dehalogenase-like hydrolase [Georgenia yuyongxinii]